jgi:hypothetical protein
MKSIAGSTTHALVPLRNGSRKRVLEEDVYVEMLEDVIEKQYFPHLSKMKRQLEFIRQNERFSLETLRNTYRNFSLLDNYNDDEENNKPLTVAEFFSRYTSEDNHSFDVIFAKDTEERKRKFHWLHESLDRLGVTDNGDVTSQRKAGMLMLYHIGNKILTADERERMDKILAGERIIGDDRPAQVDSWAFRVRNQLMFYPELKDSLQISGITNSQKGNVASNSLLLADIPTSTSSDSRIRSALPATSKVPRQLITDNDNDSFAIPALPNRKSISSTTSSDRHSLSLQTSIPSYGLNDNRRADKFIAAQNASTPATAFTDSVEAYLLGKSYNPISAEAAIAGPVLPVSNLLLEGAHTPTTLDSISIDASFPRPPPQMPIIRKTYHCNMPTNISPSADEDDWENASVVDSHRRHNYVSMTPILVPGEGLVTNAIVTWGRICGPIVILEGSSRLKKEMTAGDRDSNEVERKKYLKMQAKKDDTRKSYAPNININTTATAMDTNMLEALDNSDSSSVSFRFQDQSKRERLAMQLDSKVHASKRAKVFHSSGRPSLGSVSSASMIKTPSTPMRRLEDLSPAAQTLARKVHSAILKQKRLDK